MGIAVSKSGKMYKNPRNMMSGVSNSETPNNIGVYSYIDFVAYEIVGSELSKTKQLEQLAAWGFRVVTYDVVDRSQLTDQLLTAFIQDAKSSSPYELDGAVIEIESADSRKNNNTDALNPEYAFKYKIVDGSNSSTAVVKCVHWNVSKDGYLKPRVQIEPVNLLGVTIQYATGFNAQFIQQSGIGPGAVIRLVRSGDVIPLHIVTGKQLIR